MDKCSRSYLHARQQRFLTAKVTNTEIHARIAKALPDAEISVSGDGCNASVSVRSMVFIGKSRVEQQKVVLQLFSKEISSGELHALSVSTSS